jgi:hypothetical protein
MKKRDQNFSWQKMISIDSDHTVPKQIPVQLAKVHDDNVTKCAISNTEDTRSIYDSELCSPNESSAEISNNLMLNIVKCDKETQFWRYPMPIVRSNNLFFYLTRQP